MHPINRLNFGPNGIAITFNSGTSIVTGYIINQLGTTKFKVTADGVHFFIVNIAQTTQQAQNLPVGYMTIAISTPSGQVDYVRKITSRVLTTTNSQYFNWSINPSENATITLPTFNSTISYGSVLLESGSLILKEDSSGYFDLQ